VGQEAALILLLAGCEAEGVLGEVAAWMSFPAGRVLDPKLAGAPALTFDAGEACTLEVTNAVGQARVVTDGTWDGLDDAGAYFDPGPAEVRAECRDGEIAGIVHVVRLGVTTIDLAGEAAVPLAWHRRSLWEPEVVPIEGAEWSLAPDGALSALDEDDGAPRQAPELWEDAATPAWGDGEPGDLAYAVPSAFVAGGAVELKVEAGENAVTASGGVVDAWGPTSAVDPPVVRLVGREEDWTPGAAFTIDADPVASTMGREVRELVWTWEALDGSAWIPVPGSQTTRHELWRTAGPAQLRDGSALGFAPAVAWVGVLHDTEGALQDVPADAASVLDALRDHLFENDYVVYDPSDASYSSYEGEYIFWDYAWSELSSWLDRTDGVALYCHSMSCLLSTLAGHLGVYAPQQVLGVGFNTNLVRAAGTEEWLAWSFNSHSVVSPDDGATLWDSSISLDGDGDPAREPITETQAKGLSFEEYTTMLTGDPIQIVNSGLCYFE
jgi:hypothetical protein